jgi:hypothetical protein
MRGLTSAYPIWVGCIGSVGVSDPKSVVILPGPWNMTKKPGKRHAISSKDHDPQKPGHPIIEYMHQKLG